MIDLIDLTIDLAMIFMLSFILLRCCVSLAMSVRGIATSHEKLTRAKLEDMKASNSTG
jgi:hypothetical protein